jgi:hypothetical protein
MSSLRMNDTSRDRLIVMIDFWPCCIVGSTTPYWKKLRQPPTKFPLGLMRSIIKEWENGMEAETHTWAGFYSWDTNTRMPLP